MIQTALKATTKSSGYRKKRNHEPDEWLLGYIKRATAEEVVSLLQALQVIPFYPGALLQEPFGNPHDPQM